MNIDLKTPFVTRNFASQNSYPCINYEKCHRMIYFSPADEQKYIGLGFIGKDGKVTKPKRCPSCRREHKAQLNKQQSSFV